MSNGNGGTNLNFLDLLQEFRVVREVAQFAGRAWSWPMAQRAGRTRSILLIPGFMAGDASLYPFANWLRARGHQVYFSGIIANTDCPRRAVDRLGRILTEVSAKSKSKLVIMGHSLGGIYARELARRFPNLVDQVILMGSPVTEPHNHANPFVKMLASLTQRMTGSHCECPGYLPDVCGVNNPKPPPGMRETLIYSKSDGVVDWESCIEAGKKIEAHEVKSTHMGIPYNLDTMRIIRDRIEKVDALSLREQQARMQSG
jgi:pimeloyl-ACP methyl ester carboxylesterase